MMSLRFLHFLALLSLAAGELLDIPLWKQVPFQRANGGEPVTKGDGDSVSNVHAPKLVKFEDEETRKKGKDHKMSDK